MLRRLCAVAILVGSLPVVLAPPGAADPPAVHADLPGLDYAPALLMDPTDHQIVVAGTGGIDVVQTDLSSTVQVPSPSDVGGLALSRDNTTLWFSDMDAGALVAADAADLEHGSRTSYALPTSGLPLCPHTLAVDGSDRVWFDYQDCDSAQPRGVGWFDPATRAWDMHPLDSQLDPVSAVNQVTVNPASPNLLAFSGTNLSTVDVSGTDPIVHQTPAAARTALPGKLAVSPDGSRLSDAEGALTTMSTSDPSSSADRTTFDPAPLNSDGDGTARAVFSGDGADLAAAYNGEIISFGTATGDTGWIRRCEDTGTANVLAWDGADVVFVQSNTQPLRLSRCAAMTTPKSFIDVPVLPQPVSGKSFSVPLSLGYRGQPVTGATIDVRRDGADLPPLTTDSAGHAVLTDTASATPTRYDLSFAGDSLHPGYSTTFTITGRTVGTSFAANVRTTRPIDRVMTVHDRLLGDGHGLAGEHLTVTRVDALGRHHLAGAVTDAQGRFSITDTPRYGPQTTYVVGFAGDGGYQHSTNTYRVDVTRKRPDLRIGLREKAIWYDQQATVRIHLGATYNRRSVSLYALPVHGRRHHVLTATVNRHGDLTARVAMSRNTTFYADFTGDPRYGAREVSVKELSGLLPELRIGGDHGTSGKYHLYRAGDDVKLTGTLLPAHAGRCLQFDAFQRKNGRWVADPASPCFTTDRHGVAKAYFHATRPRLGVPYAIESFFAGDAEHCRSWSGFTYFEFTAASSRSASARSSGKGAWTIGP